MAAFPSYAQDHHHTDAANVEQLGSVSFPISCSASAQKSFNRGVALLHSFSYRLANGQFREIAEQEPACAMAYWGEAMSLYRQLWDRPGPDELKQGIGLMQQAQAAPIKTDRERGYIDAAAAFYSADASATFDTRRTAYSDALARLHSRFPADDEASLFLALSLLTSPNVDKNESAIRRQAVVLLNQVFELQPDHPGAAHYIIHACDTPAMAKRGLAAAHRYAQIAPASAHALHMPSHIFARLGLWDDDIRSNLASIASAERQKATADRLHAMNFVEYAYLQQGRFEEAKAVESKALEVKKEDFGDMPGMFNYVRVRFPSLYLLETEQWKEAESLPLPPELEPDFKAGIFWTRAVAAGHNHDVAVAETAIRDYDSAIEAVRQTDYAYVAELMKGSQDEAHAWLDYLKGDINGALSRLSTVADKQDREGKGEVELPAREMRADMLLALNRPQDALTEYERSLQTDPNRFNSLLGAAHSAEKADLPQRAQSYYQQLLKGREQFSNPALDAARLYMSHAQLANPRHP